MNDPTVNKPDQGYAYVKPKYNLREQTLLVHNAYSLKDVTGNLPIDSVDSKQSETLGEIGIKYNSVAD